jgi:hypothetical protein
LGIINIAKSKWAADKDQQPILLFSFGGLKKLLLSLAAIIR